MKRQWLAMGMIVAALAARGGELEDARAYQKSRAAVADLTRITAPTGIQESYKADIGGIGQWLYVRGQDRANPIILFVHGGPASPAIPTAWQFQRPIEEYFTVVHWDQRGAGLTYRDNPPAQVAPTLTVARYVDDTIEVAEHLRKRHGKGKIILMAHSWGTVPALGAALKRPDLFHAYVGVGQVISTRENERISFDYAQAEATKRNDQEALKDLASIAPYPGELPITRERIVTARKWPQHYGGLSAFRSESTYYFGGPRLSPDYAPDDVATIDQGNVFSLGRLLPEFVTVDYSRVDTLRIPVVMFLGRHDYTTPTAPTEAWLRKLRAPYKQAVWFERSAHMVPWEEPGKTLVSLLRYVRPLADGKMPAAE
ncbi:alpha/beta fold hydrolase [Pseudoduganella buxea]|uniref:Alpha/beta fold hydrolase n=1 Tax=Pseudoduganella buxea TaxID=1949069 RepID=A0A6I3T346_9BURK|nr:alpha/beta hydrolase [Pseudoduganella buxea]MTV56028.1 alpha/beta fold hydrolase [Pseudoduganella buxea]GGB94752.1 alpha/beta hydrolase [Pseudoduganella buxea]